MSEHYQIGYLEVESPYGNAGGVVKSVEDVELMAHSGVGWIEAGSFTLEKRIGNSPNGEVVYCYNAVTGETGNALGMPNKGIDIVEEDIPTMVEIAHAYGKSLLVNVAPVSDDPVAEAKELVERAYLAGADMVLLNAGCPNVVIENGERHEILSKNPAALSAVLNGLKPIVQKHDRKIAVRTSPVESYGQARKTMWAIQMCGVVAVVFTPNTWSGYKPTDEAGNYILEVPGNSGGKSGPATADDALEQTLWAVDALKGSGIDVVSSGGIMNGRELQQRMAAGAAGGAGTTLFRHAQ